MAAQWQREADVVVLGTGGGGLLAALAAHEAGASVCVLEKSSLIGGTTAISGGVIWFPNNHRELEAGFDDDPHAAIKYIETIADGRGQQEWIKTYVHRGPEMLKWVEQHTSIEFICLPTFPDYHPELDGAKAGGRSLDNGLFDTTLLGEWRGKLRTNPINGALPIPVSESLQMAANPLDDYTEALQRGKDGIVHGGASLIGKLLLACLERDIEPVLEAAAHDLVVDPSGRVNGVVATTPDGELRVRARGGVIMAMGGFEWSDELRRDFLPLHAKHPASPPHNTGDGLKMAMRLGAELGNMPEAWWAPTIAVPDARYDGAPLYESDFAMRLLPHSIIVNRRGKRFTNESANYNDMAKPWFNHDPTRYEQTNSPSWIIVDAQFRRKYSIHRTGPGRPLPDYIEQADTLEALADKLGIDPEGLLDTVARFNGFCAEGEDRDFGRGWSAYDRFFGDARHGPNPNLGTLERGPFCAIPIHPGMLGTKGGPKTTTSAQVRRVGGGNIAGLYAVGNTAAGLGGAGYAGGGITIGASMLMGWIAGEHAARSMDR